MLFPYLTDPLATRFDRWLEASVARYVPPLTYTELRKGVQALSSLYVERRHDGPIAPRAIEGVGKRGAFASYYAALHFLTTHHAFAMIGGGDQLGTPTRVIDLGCGTGPTGAAIATSYPQPPSVTGIDRSGWALEEAEHTWLAFGLKGRAVRQEIPDSVPQVGSGDLLSFGWMISELADDARAALLRRLIRWLRAGAAVMITEPLATGVTPWWPLWSEALAEYGVRADLCKVAIVRPDWIADMDKAARLDHQVIGARVLSGRTKNRAR
jgi:SAM-dependent methyltransferase